MRKSLDGLCPIMQKTANYVQNCARA